MNYIVIRFTGIAVHIDHDSFPPLRKSRHRVIFISHLTNPPGGVEVRPHVATLFLPEPRAIQLGCAIDVADEIEYILNGVAMRIPNATGELELDPCYDEYVPRLGAAAGVLPPNEGVILHGHEPAAVYFDIDHGTLSACLATAKGAIGTHLIVETEGKPQLELKCFRGDDTQVLEFDSGSVLTILNIAEEGVDDEDDFILSYGVCATIPPERDRVKPTAPAVNPPTLCLVDDDPLRFGDIDFGAGCSNSGYP